MKAYITQSNFHRIINNNELNDGDKKYLYKGKILRFLSFKHLEYLNKYSIFMDELTKGEIIFFKTLKINKDTYTKVFESGIPAYHTNKNCSKLHSDYKNYEIPLPLLEKLKKDYDLWINQMENSFNFEKKFYEKWKLELPIDRGGNENLISFIWENEAKKFRNWFNNNSELFKKNEEEFNEKMYNDWKVKGFHKKYEYDNSGVIEIENLTGLELENFIDNKIKERSLYIKGLSNQEILIINFLGKNVYLFKDINVETNEQEFWNIVKEFHKKYKGPKQNFSNLFEGYNYKQVYELLTNYDKNYIEVIKRALLQYITIKLNPDLKFESNILEVLGFKICYDCGN